MITCKYCGYDCCLDVSEEENCTAKGSSQFDLTLRQKPNKEVAIKFDEDKTNWNYLYYPTFEKLCDVMVKGSKKYGFENWKKKKRTENMFQNAIMRHWVLIQKGEWIDKESKQPHIIHIIANCMMEDYQHE